MDLLRVMLRRAFFRPLRLCMVNAEGKVVEAETRSFRRLLELYFKYWQRGFW